MATLYWMGGGAAWEPVASATYLCWNTVSPSASFTGTAPASTVSPYAAVFTFTNMIGTPVVGDNIYINGVAVARVFSAPTFTDSPTNTAGYFSIRYFVSQSSTTTAQVSAAYATATATPPVAGDNIIINQYGMFSSDVIISKITGLSFASLNLSGMRGAIVQNTYNLGITISGLITFPALRAVTYVKSSEPLVISLTNTTTIDNNGTTKLSKYALQSIIIFYAPSTTATTIPSNIIVGELYIGASNTVNLGSATYYVSAFVNYSTSMNAGTSTINIDNDVGTQVGFTSTFPFISGTPIIPGDFYGSSNNTGRTFYNLIANGVSIRDTGNSFNIFTLANVTITSGYLGIDANYGTTITANKFNLLTSATPVTIIGPGYGTVGANMTLHQNSSQQVLIQGTLPPSKTSSDIDGISNTTFTPANTFFSVANDYSKSFIPTGNVGLRPATTPMMMV